MVVKGIVVIHSISERIVMAFWSNITIFMFMSIFVNISTNIIYNPLVLILFLNGIEKTIKSIQDNRLIQLLSNPTLPSGSHIRLDKAFHKFYPIICMIITLMEISISILYILEPADGFGSLDLNRLLLIACIIIQSINFIHHLTRLFIILFNFEAQYMSIQTGCTIELAVPLSGDGCHKAHSLFIIKSLYLPLDSI